MIEQNYDYVENRFEGLSPRVTLTQALMLHVLGYDIPTRAYYADKCKDKKPWIEYVLNESLDYNRRKEITDGKMEDVQLLAPQIIQAVFWLNDKYGFLAVAHPSPDNENGWESYVYTTKDRMIDGRNVRRGWTVQSGTDLCYNDYMTALSKGLTRGLELALADSGLDAEFKNLGDQTDAWKKNKSDYCAFHRESGHCTRCKVQDGEESPLCRWDTEKACDDFVERLCVSVRVDRPVDEINVQIGLVPEKDSIVGTLTKPTE